MAAPVRSGLLAAMVLFSTGMSSAATLTAQTVTWRFIGPGAGGSMFGVAFCPTDPNIIVFGGDMGAMYRTEDGGGHWTIVGGPSGHQPSTGGVWDVRFDLKHPNIVWSAGQGVYRSVDYGKTWQDIGQGIAFSRGRRITIDPINPRRFFVHARFAVIEGVDPEAPR